MPEPELTADQLFVKTIHFLKFRSRSKAEVERYLKQKMGSRYNPDIVQEAIYNLEQSNLLNDSSFAAELAQSLLRSGKGPKMIELKLREKNVDSNIIANTIASLDAALIKEAAYAVLQKKIKTVRESNPFKKKQMLIKFLYSRGFEPKLGYELIDANGELQVQ
jgi:regulatory protein